jgi:hypothetical protein
MRVVWTAYRRSFPAVAIVFTVAFEASADVGSHDGNWWRKQEDSLKIGYVIGCMDHLVAANPEWAKGVTFGHVLSFNEIVDRLNLFYSDSRNRSVPVQVAIPAIVFKIAKSKPEPIQPSR